jgi:hypothetical protein
MALSSATRTKNLRRSRRYLVDAGALQVSWLDVRGNMKTARTRALNISEDGLALELPEAAMPLLVRFKSEKFNVKGVGSVRYCRRAAGKYVVGLEFGENLHWHAPQEEMREPIPMCDPESVK